MRRFNSQCPYPARDPVRGGQSRQ